MRNIGVFGKQEATVPAVKRQIGLRGAGFWSSAGCRLPGQSISERGGTLSQRSGLGGGWGGPHLAPSFQWPLPPLEEVSLTDSRSGHVRAFPCGDLCLQVVHHFPVFA